MVETESDATRRLNVKKQTLDDAYAVPANFLEIDVVNPMTSIATGKKRYTDYEVRMRVSIIHNFFVLRSSEYYYHIIVVSTYTYIDLLEIWHVHWIVKLSSFLFISD